MRRARSLWGVGVVLALACGGPSDDALPKHARHDEAASPDTAQDAQSWTCVMHPHIHLSEPGRCPMCGMDLVAVTAEPEGEPGGLRLLTLSESAMRRAEIRTASVERRPLRSEIRLLGKLEVDETRVRRVTAWVPGRLDRLYVDFTGDSVNRGDRLVLLYSPELASAQQELLQARRTVRAVEESHSERIRASAQATLEASREKLRLLGLSEAQVARVERRGKVEHRITIHSPLKGIVLEKHGVEGMYVKTGTPIYTVADLSTLWAQLDAHESDLAWVQVGQDVSFESQALPGRHFQGQISFVDPVLDPRSRTAKVRVEIGNPEGLLKPEMFVTAVLYAEAHGDASEPPLVIPDTAPLFTGRRSIVYVRVPGTKHPSFESREVVLGPRAGDYYIVESGLQEGDRVVVHGAFKIDSELQIQGKPSMMLPEGGRSGGAGHGGHTN